MSVVTRMELHRMGPDDQPAVVMWAALECLVAETGSPFIKVAMVLEFIRSGKVMIAKDVIAENPNSKFDFDDTDAQKAFLELGVAGKIKLTTITSSTLEVVRESLGE